MSAPPSSWLRRMLGCARLYADTYEEVEADRSSIRQALAIVVLAAVSAAVGAWLETLSWRSTQAGGSLGLLLEMAARAIEPLALWLGGSAFAYMVGASFFRTEDTETDYAEVLRTTGFAFTPALLSFLCCLPPLALGLGVLTVLRIWTWLAVVVAVRQALDFSTQHAIGTVGVGWVLGWLMMWGAVSVSIQFAQLLG